MVHPKRWADVAEINYMTFKIWTLKLGIITKCLPDLRSHRKMCLVAGNENDKLKHCFLKSVQNMKLCFTMMESYFKT